MHSCIYTTLQRSELQVLTHVSYVAYAFFSRLFLLRSRVSVPQTQLLGDERLSIGVYEAIGMT